MIFNKSLNYQS